MSDRLYTTENLEDFADEGDRAFVVSMLRMFITNAPKAIEDMKAANAAGDLKKVKEISHRNGPSFSSVCVESVANHVLQIEHLAAAGGTAEEINAHLEQLGAKTELVISQIKQHEKEF